MSRIYRKSPIIEVVCELLFTETSPWTSQMPLAFYEQVRADFPRFAPEARINFQIGQTAAGTHSGAAVFQTDPLMVFSRDDGLASVQLSRRLLAISQFAPYPTWSTLHPMIAHVIESYRMIGKPDGIERIGLRYINRIDLPPDTGGLRTYFSVYPHHTHLGRVPRESHLQLMFPFAAGRDMLTLALFAQDTTTHSTVVLDLDYAVGTANTVSMDTAMTWIDTAHDAIEQIFEESITDALRTLMEEVPT